MDATTALPDLSNKPIYHIANIIKADWKPRIHPTAYPYWEAMLSMSTVNDKYGDDSGKSIIGYFLGNAQTWKGETARAVKAHLKKLIA
jgi:hypothetical protein